MRHRRQSDEAVPPVVDTASESYQLLHVTLTGFGDTSREVQVVSNDAVLAATVGINLAVAAARDSRSTLLVDSGAPHSVIMRMLNGAKKVPGATPVQPERCVRTCTNARRPRRVHDTVPVTASASADEWLGDDART